MLLKSLLESIQLSPSLRIMVEVRGRTRRHLLQLLLLLFQLLLLLQEELPVLRSCYRSRCIYCWPCTQLLWGTCHWMVGSGGVIQVV